MAAAPDSGTVVAMVMEMFLLLKKIVRRCALSLKDQVCCKCFKWLFQKLFKSLFSEMYIFFIENVSLNTGPHPQAKTILVHLSAATEKESKICHLLYKQYPLINQWNYQDTFQWMFPARYFSIIIINIIIQITCKPPNLISTVEPR